MNVILLSNVMPSVFTLKFNVYILKLFQATELTRMSSSGRQWICRRTKWLTVQGHLLFYKIRKWKTPIPNSNEIIPQF
jgi:hypothetical protein